MPRSVARRSGGARAVAVGGPTSNGMKRSQFRQDVVSGDWVLVAPGRFHGHISIRQHRVRRKVALKTRCPFERPFSSVSETVILGYPAGAVRREATAGWGSYRLLVLQNRYPAVAHRSDTVQRGTHGPFSTEPGVGHHDLIITRDHRRNFTKLSPGGASLVLEALRDRYLMLVADPNVRYVSMFHNWGPLAGATVYHPHYQLIAVPVAPPDVQRSLDGSARYYRERKRCVHCLLIDWERRQRKRVIVETADAIAIAPYVSRNPFEVRVFPKRHLPYFESTPDRYLDGVARVLQVVLRWIERRLYDPDYNFFIHTSPLRGKGRYRHYHWHVEVYPKFSTRAGFEFGTGIEINPVDPDLAAKIIRG